MEPVNKKQRVDDIDTEVVRRHTTEEPAVKKTRIDDELSHDHSTTEVEISKTFLNHEGIVTSGLFISKVKRQSMQEIRHRIDRDDELNIGPHVFHLYPAFKEALLRLLEKIEEAQTGEKSPVRIILVHGVPGIGQTSLAQCLSYFLALSAGQKETVCFLGLSHSSKTNNNFTTNSIIDACSNEYLIVDQVNTNTLKCSDMVAPTRNRFTVGKIRTPLIIFTSGHYTPSQEWLNMQSTGFLCYKLIAMRIDASLVSRLKESMTLPQDVTITNDDLLKVTTCYSRMYKCLNHLLFCDSTAGKGALRDEIYPYADLRLIRSKWALHFIWLAWKDLLTKWLPPQDQFSKDDCHLAPHHVEYLGYLISVIKDTADRGINAVLNLMDITGHKQYERNGYSEFDSDSYQYKFVSKKCLYEVLSYAVKQNEEMSLDQKYQLTLSAYNQLTKAGDAEYQYLQGELFERIIIIICEKEQEKLKHPFGMAVRQPGLTFFRVSHSETVATELELCSLPNKYQMAKRESMNFWCVLNAPGKRPCRGFDFAYMETEPIGDKPVLAKLQLFQVSVNPGRKTLESKMNMTDVLIRIKAELVKLKLTNDSEADKVIVPYFVHPYSEKYHIDLPFRKSKTSIKAVVVDFPLALLCPQGK